MVALVASLFGEVQGVAFWPSAHGFRVFLGQVVLRFDC